MDRMIMLVDLDYFYVQVEENRNPGLEGKPVVVGMYSGRTERSGAVATCSYEAREYGVHSGMVLSRAYDILEDVENDEFLKPDFDEYERVSGNIMDILREQADSFEQISIDEAWLDVSDRVYGYEGGEELAREIKKRIKDETSITCSIGIGPNKLIAKMAADIDKPDGLTVVRGDGFLDTFGDDPTDELYGIGPKTRDKLEEMGIETIGELAEADIRKLQERFGRKLGTYFHEAANGRDDEPVEEQEPQQFGRIVTLENNTRDVSDFRGLLRELAEEVVERVEDNGYRFKRIGIHAVMEDIEDVTRSRTLNSYATDADVVAETAEELFEQLLEEDEREIRRVGVRVSGLEKGSTGLDEWM